MKAAASSIVDDGTQDGTSSLNLSILLGTLVPSSMVGEDDTTWTFESLLREITDELTPTPKSVVSVVSSYGESASGNQQKSLIKTPEPSSPTKKLLLDKKHK